MNSDPHESAAWRAFGMLDTDETAGFDEASRRDPALLGASREVDRLSAAIAAATVTPVKPHPGQLDRLHARLGLNAPRRRNWMAISGWAAAAAIAMIAVLDRAVFIQKNSFTVSHPAAPVHAPVEVAAVEPESAVVETSVPEELYVEDSTTIPAIPLSTPAGIAEAELISKAKVENRRLIQEIEVLREQWADLKQRESERFDVVPGMSQFVMVEMRPPGFQETVDAAIGDSNPGLTTRVSDALAATGRNDVGKAGPVGMAETAGTAGPASPTTPPATYVPATNLPASGYPIYDSARDAGSLVVTNLPPKNENEEYNLWVTTKRGKDPVYVGALPESTAEGENQFDFSLGDTGIVPTRFYMTKDPRGKTRAPSSGNTILQGPN